MSTLVRLSFLAAAALLAAGVVCWALAARVAPRGDGARAAAARAVASLADDALALHDRLRSADGAAREAYALRLERTEAALRSEASAAGDATLHAVAGTHVDGASPQARRAALEATRAVAGQIAAASAGVGDARASAAAARLQGVAAGASAAALALLVAGLAGLWRAERRGAEERRRLEELLPTTGNEAALGERVARLRGKADRLAERSDRALMGRLSLAEALASYEAAQARLHAAQDELTERLRGAKDEIERLKVSSMLDELTGALKYPYMVHRIRELLRELLDHDRPFCLLELDLDNFKDVNDTYGHAAGDDALREFGRLLRDHSREGDLVIRKSGDEFFVIAPGALLEDALALGERLREAVNTHTVVSTSAAGDRYEFPLAASVGVLDVSHADLTTLRSIADPDLAVREVISYVDAALYRAKHAGKNCVRGYEAGLRVVDLRHSGAPPDLSRINRLVPSRYPHLAPAARARVDALLAEASEVLFPKRHRRGEDGRQRRDDISSET